MTVIGHISFKVPIVLIYECFSCVGSGWHFLVIWARILRRKYVTFRWRHLPVSTVIEKWQCFRRVCPFRITRKFYPLANLILQPFRQACFSLLKFEIRSAEFISFSTCLSKKNNNNNEYLVDMLFRSETLIHTFVSLFIGIHGLNQTWNRKHMFIMLLSLWKYLENAASMIYVNAYFLSTKNTRINLDE